MILLVKMCCNLLVLVITLINLGVVQEAAYLTEAYRKSMYQKDMSQYCRRNVIPSVFLGRQVINAYSKILHFSRLEVPYSCFINVRTEMGSNIIVVIQVNNDVDMEKSCSEDSSQLIIHEMGETFGGYWGPIPDSVLKHDFHRQYNSYTLRPQTTLPPSTTTTRTTYSTTTTPLLKNKSAIEKSAEDLQKQDYLTLELPIVNVSAEIVPDRLPYIPHGTVPTPQDIFDLSFGIIPRKKVSYDAQIVPIVEFALKKHKSGQDGDGNTNIYEVKYNTELQLQFNDLFTPDPRLTLPTINSRNYKRKQYKYQPRENKLLDFRKNKKFFAPKDVSFYKRFPITQRRSHLGIVPTNKYLSKLYDATQSYTLADETEKYIKFNSWEAVHNILKKLSDNKHSQTEAPHQELANFLRRIAKTETNKSVYLAPNVLSETSLKLVFTEQTMESSTKTHQDTSYNESSSIGKIFTMLPNFNIPANLSNSLNINNSTVYNDGTIVRLLPLALDIDNIILSVENSNNNMNEKEDKRSNTTPGASSATITKRLQPITVSLVDHESWENVVKVAPVMAVKLNKTHVITAEDEINATKSTKSKVRKKRFIHAIDIEIAKPHQLHVRRHTSTTQPPVVLDMREFQRLIEMQDDEIYGRVSLQNLRPYIGPPLLNICALNSTSNRHVYLFNSSRIVLAISNFTMKRMTVVVTPARTLRDFDARCAPHNIECQISGVRVCIDSLTACDDVPNCGSYDIYDEDRLQCGSASGLRHNVCLAAITFLAAVLTILYTIHYWLKRCVPKVSDAFFIYTDAAVNTLYVDTIMRSPFDIGYSKEFYQEEEQELDYINIDVKENFCKRFINRCVLFLRCKRRKASQDIDAIERMELNEGFQKLSSFAETEIDRIALEAPFMSSASEIGVQTENCFEMKEFSPIYLKEENFVEHNSEHKPIEASGLINHDLNLNQASDELFMLKFLKEGRPRSISRQLNAVEDVMTAQLSGIQFPEDSKYSQNDFNGNDCKMDEALKVQLSNKSIEICDDDYKNKPVVRKQLRFHEETTIIPNTSDEELEDRLPTVNNNRRSVLLGVNKLAISNDDKEPSNSAGRELKSYFNWGCPKDKKKKKKK